jgi:hypothetical protein
VQAALLIEPVIWTWGLLVMPPIVHSMLAALQVRAAWSAACTARILHSKIYSCKLDVGPWPSDANPCMHSA